MVFDRLQQSGRCRCTKTFVDVEPVGLATNGDDFGAEFMEDIGCHVVGGTVSCIDHDFQTLEAEVAVYGALAKFNVAPLRVGQTAGAPQGGGINPLAVLAYGRLHAVFPFVGQLFTARGKELHAVVTKGVVGSADHHPQI